MPVAASELSSESPRVPCTCQVRAQQRRPARRNLQFAPDPPPELTGPLAYGYMVELPVAEKVLHEMLGENLKNMRNFQRYILFESACRKAIRPVSRRGVPSFDILRTLEPDVDILKSFVIAIAKDDSKVLPPKEEVDRLKAFLETDAEPGWYETI